jgi:sec-independent protein translocase protein TatC
MALLEKLRARARDADPDAMPFLDHLEELRRRILWILAALAMGFFIGLWVVTHFQVLQLLIAPIEPLLGNTRLKYLSPTDPFFITLKLAAVVGLLLVLPLVVYHVWAFFSPALLPSERRSIVPALYLGLVLFAAGVALAYFLALPITLRFTMSFQGESLEQAIVIGPYLAIVVRLLLAFGAIFELPVVMLVLATLGLVSSAGLKAKRRYAIVAIAVVASIITPGDVVVLTVFLMVPLVLLYELSIGLTRMVERRRTPASMPDPERWMGAS